MKTLAQRSDGSLGFAGQGMVTAYKFRVESIGAEAGDAIDVTFQLTNGAGNALKIAGFVGMFVVNANTAGDYQPSTALTTLAVQTGYLIWAPTANVAILAATDANGQVVLRGTIAGATTRRITATPWGGLGTPTQTGTITWAA